MSEGSGVVQAREEAGQGFFDRFAGRSADFVSRAHFFTFCALLVIIWAPSYFLVGNFDTYQLIINTPTTIITFLLHSPRTGLGASAAARLGLGAPEYGRPGGRNRGDRALPNELRPRQGPPLSNAV